MSASCVSVDPGKAEVVMSWERPKSVFEICSFLGIGRVLQEFYRGFLPASSAYEKIDQEGGQVCMG